MATALLDSNVLIAARLANDQNHAPGTAITNGVETGTLPNARVPDDALSEVLNYLHTRAGHGVAVETLDAVLSTPNFEVDRTTAADFDTGRTLFRRYEGLSLTDSVLCAHARRTGVEYLYSFDDDFDAVDGITRLDTAANPYHD
jgi:predicted nucleic acid-binding protein